MVTEVEMPAISMFYGVIIYMFFFDDKKHHRPYIHAHYGDQSAVIAIDDGEVLQGDLPKKKLKLVQAWIEIHQDGRLEVGSRRSTIIQN